MQTSDSRGDAAATWRPTGCALGKTPEFHGKTPDEVVTEIGEPARKDVFKIGERQDEFRVELQNTYPLSVEGNGDVEVQEWNWKHDDCNLTLWFHAPSGDWSVFESLVWPDDVDF